MTSRGLFALHNFMLFNSNFLIKRRVLLEAAWAAAAEFCVFNVIRGNSWGGSWAPSSQAVAGWWWLLAGQATWAMRGVQEVPWHTARLRGVGQFPCWLLRMASSWENGEWVVAICISWLVTCAATDNGAQCTVCRAVGMCVCSISISWYTGGYLWKRASGRF